MGTEQDSMDVEVLTPNEDDLVPVVFTWSHSGRQVYITGTFNNWQEQIPMFRSGNDFTYIHNLTRGKHVYKFIVDDEWRFAPDQVGVVAVTAAAIYLTLCLALRVQLLKPSELDRYTKIFAGKRISLENELDVMRQLVAACDTLLKMYPTTALEDQKQLQDAKAFGALSPRAQTALVLVFGEKRVLHRTVELISHAWSLLLVEGWSD